MKTDLQTRWQTALHARFMGQPLPLLHADGETWTAASLWAGSRLWVKAFRAAGLVPGDRLIAEVAPAPAFVQVLLAALWEGLTLAPVLPQPADHLSMLAARLDARALVSSAALPGAWQPQASHLPPETVPSLRPVVHSPTPQIRFLLRTSGSTGGGDWVALSDANLFTVLDSHGPALALDGARMLSLLPWHHAFGLVLDLLVSLLAGAEIVRLPDGGRDLDRLLAAAREGQVTHLNAVPLTLLRLVEQPEGRALLTELTGGIVGGAPVHEPLATRLAATQLRAGYGQTEASPGICLGAPGVWRDGTIGRPLGCEVQLSSAGELLFRGGNACAGIWTTNGFAALPLDRWVPTGDLVRQEADGTFTFLGRAASSFKLANGRAVEVARLEADIRAAWPAVQEVALLPGDGMAVDLVVQFQREATTPARVMPPEVVAILGGLAKLPWRLVEREGEWPRTVKGETDRRRLGGMV